MIDLTKPIRTKIRKKPVTLEPMVPIKRYCVRFADGSTLTETAETLENFYENVPEPETFRFAGGTQLDPPNARGECDFRIRLPEWPGARHWAASDLLRLRDWIDKVYPRK